MFTNVLDPKNARIARPTEIFCMYCDKHLSLGDLVHWGLHPYTYGETTGKMWIFYCSYCDREMGFLPEIAQEISNIV